MNLNGFQSSSVISIIFWLLGLTSLFVSIVNFLSVVYRNDSFIIIVFMKKHVPLMYIICLAIFIVIGSKCNQKRQGRVRLKGLILYFFLSLIGFGGALFELLALFYSHNPDILLLKQNIIIGFIISTIIYFCLIPTGAPS